MNDDRILLASRYLDGDLTPEERALVDGDAELLAEVQRMRSVREALVDVPAPPSTTRDAAVAAALAAAGTPGTPAAPPVASLTARRRARWLVPAAAALVGVLALGGLASFFAGTGDDDDDSASMELAADTDALAEVTDAADGDQAGGGEDDAARTAAAADTEAPEGTVAGTIASQERATTAGDAQSAATTAAVAADTGPAGGSRTSLARMSTPQDLRDFARGEPPEESVSEPATTLSADTDPAALAQRCGLGDLVGTAYYVVDGTDEFVLVVVDADEALAVTPTCTVVARAPLR